MFIAVLLITAPNLKHSKYLHQITGGKIFSIHTLECYSAI